MPIVAVVTGALGMQLYHWLSRAGALGRAGRYVGVALGIAVAVAGPIGLMLHDFAVTGTLAGYPGDPGLCGADNVPPWYGPARQPRCGLPKPLAPPIPADLSGVSRGKAF